MARNNEKIIILVTEKLKLLEKFISLQTKFARKYGWKVSKIDQMQLIDISKQLEKVTQDIDNAIRE